MDQDDRFDADLMEEEDLYGVSGDEAEEEGESDSEMAESEEQDEVQPGSQNMDQEQQRARSNADPMEEDESDDLYGVSDDEL